MFAIKLDYLDGNGRRQTLEMCVALEKLPDLLDWLRVQNPGAKIES